MDDALRDSCSRRERGSSGAANVLTHVIGSFEEQRQRTKVIPRLMSEFATMIPADPRWCQVSNDDIERHQCRLLHTELRLNPPA